MKEKVEVGLKADAAFKPVGWTVNGAPGVVTVKVEEREGKIGVEGGSGANKWHPRRARNAGRRRSWVFVARSKCVGCTGIPQTSEVEDLAQWTMAHTGYLAEKGWCLLADEG